MFEEFKFRIRKFLPCQAIGLANALVIYLLVVSFLFLSARDIAEQIVEGFSFPLLAKAFLLLFLVSISYSFTIVLMLTKLNEQSIRNIDYKLVLKGTLVNFLVFLLLVAESIFVVFYLNVELSLPIAIVVYFIVVFLFVFIFSLQLVYFSLNGSKLTKRLFILSFLFSFVRLSAMQLANFLSFTVQVGSAFLMPLFDGIVLPPVLFELSKRKENNKSKVVNGIKNLSIKKFLISLVILSLIISSEFKPLIVFSSPSDRLNEIISQAIAEGWSNEELSSEIKKDSSLVNYLSIYDLDKITIDRREDGSVVVNIPSKNLTPFYYVYSKINSSKIVYDVYKQVNGSTIKAGDKVYVLSKYDTSTSTYEPLSLEEAVSLSNNLQKKGEITNIYYKEASRKVVKTKEETTYSIVPYVREVSYETKVVKSFDTIYEAQNYLNSLRYEDPSKNYEVAEGTKLISYQVPVYSYYWEFSKSFSSYSDALSYANEQRYAKIVNSTKEVKLYKLYVKERTERYDFVGVYEENDPNLGDCLQNTPTYVNGEYRYYGWYIVENGKLNPTAYAVYYGTRTKAFYDVYVRKARIEGYEVRYQEVKVYNVVEKTPVVKEYYKEVDRFKNFKKKEEALASEGQLKNYIENELKLSYIGYKIEESKNNVSYEDVEYYKVYYVNSTSLTPLYNVYQLVPYENTYEETSYKEYYAWVDKGYASTIPNSYDNKTWVYIPELVNYTKIYLGLYIEPIAVSLKNSSARYLIEKYNDTTIKIDVNYYNVYELIKKLMYDYYVWVQYPVKEYLADSNITSLSFWSFDKFGEASAYLSEDAHSKPYSLCLSTKNGIGALRQEFYYSKDRTSVFLSFWYKANGSVLFALRTPSNIGYVFSLNNSNDWKYYSINLTRIMNETGYYLFSLVAHRNSALLVDDVSLHSGGYGEWTFVKEVDEKPSNYSSLEKYLPFYKILGKKLIGIFPEYSLSNFSSSDYVFEFNTTKEFSFNTSLYRVYYLSGGSIRYKVYHYEELKVPVTVTKVVKGVRSELIEENVRAPESGVLVASGVSNEEIKNYADPSYRIVPRVVSEEKEVLVLNTTNKDEADGYRSKGYIVKTEYKNIGNDITISFHVLYAEIVQDETRMLGKYNLLKVVVSNPSPYSYSYEVDLEASNNFVASPNSFSLSASSRQSSGGVFSFIVQKKVNEETPYPSENQTILTSSLQNEESCDFLVVLKRGGKIVAEYKLSRTFKGFNPVESINLHPGEFVQGFVSGAAATAGTVILTSFVSLPVIPLILAASFAYGFLTLAETGSIGEAALNSIPLIPYLRAFLDPTLDEAYRAGLLGSIASILPGTKLGEVLASEVAEIRLSNVAPELTSYDSEVYRRLCTIREDYGDLTFVKIANGLTKLLSFEGSIEFSKEGINNILVNLLSVGSRKEAEELAFIFDRISNLPNEFLEEHANEILSLIRNTERREDLVALLSLSKEKLSEYSGFSIEDTINIAKMDILKLSDKIKIIKWDPTSGVEVGIEKEAAEKIFPNLKIGDLVKFKLVGEGESKSIVLEYYSDLADIKSNKWYYLFSLPKGDELAYLSENFPSSPSNLMLDLSTSKEIGIDVVSYEGIVAGKLSEDGEIKLEDGTTYKLNDFSIKLVDGKELGSSNINELTYSANVGGSTVLIREDGSLLAKYESTYLPAAFYEDRGISVGTLALPSASSLVVQPNVRENSIVEVLYPSGRSLLEVYTKGSLEIPKLEYDRGAFVLVKEVPLAYSADVVQQLDSFSLLLTKELGRSVGENFLRSVVKYKLEEPRLVSLLNTVLEEFELIKEVSKFTNASSVLEELVRESSNKDPKVVLKEAVELQKSEEASVLASIEEFASVVEKYDYELAQDIRRLLYCVYNNLGPDAVEWLLGFMKSIALAYGNPVEEYYVDTSKLRDFVYYVLNYRESREQNCMLASSIVQELRQFENALIEDYLSLIESRNDIRSFEDRENLFKSFFSMEKVYGVVDGRSIRNFFVEDVKRDGEVALKAWVTAVENREIARRIYEEGGFPALKISKGIAKAFNLESGDYVKLIAEVNNEEFPFLAKIGDVHNNMFRVLVKRGSFANFAIKDGDYVRISKDLSGILAYVESEANGPTRIRLSGDFDNDFIRIKLGSDSGVGILKYGKVIEYDENGNPRAVTSPKFYYVIREFEPDYYYNVLLTGPGLYALDIIKLTPQDYANALSLSKSSIPVEYDAIRKEVVMKTEDIYLEGTDFEYVYNLKVSDLVRGGLRATVTLNNDTGRAIAVDLLADQNSGKLNTVYSFIPSKEDSGRDIKSFELTKSLKDGAIRLIVKYIHGSDIWAVRMKWNKDTSEFVDEHIHPYDDEFEEIERKVLNYVKNLNLVELEKIDDGLTRVFSVGNLEDFASLRSDMLICDSTAQGILSTEIIRELLLEERRSNFGIPNDVAITVDKTGKNIKGNLFDINATDRNRKIIYFVAEAKSHLSGEGNLDQDFDKMKGELRSHKNDVIENLKERELKDWILPKYGYAFSMNIFSDKIEIFVRKFDFNKADEEGKKGEWVKW